LAKKDLKNLPTAPVCKSAMSHVQTE